jgi:hypothetical protein
MHLHERMVIETVRDNVCHLLHEYNPKMFPIGAYYVNVVDLASTMSVLSQPIADTVYECTQCDYAIETRSEIDYFAELQHSVLDIQSSDTIAQILGRLLSTRSNRMCPEMWWSHVKKYIHK